MKLDPTKPPGDNFPALACFKLTLPSGKEIPSKQLVEGFRQIGVFDTDPNNGGVMFRCPNIAGTTPGSHYSRCELRETRKPDGPASAPENNWTIAEGATIKASLQVNRVSTTGDADKVGRVVFMQFHGPDSEVARVYYIKKPGDVTGRILMGMDDTHNKTTWSPSIMRDVALNAKFTAILKVKDRHLSLHLHDSGGMAFAYNHIIDAGYAGKLCYSKIGNYNQNNTGELDDYAQVTFLRLGVLHP